ncbi:hypothetical protein [Streptomyces sp. NPDC005953]|uniref:hypothetical protein n=1 Tax=Streptomyces sp. NPDC005953 TaxID=3156719 RepID=UPI0033F2EC32
MNSPSTPIYKVKCGLDTQRSHKRTRTYSTSETRTDHARCARALLVHGQQTWTYGTPKIPGDPHIIWRRIDDHDILTAA